MKKVYFLFLPVLISFGLAYPGEEKNDFDTILRNGIIYDGSGNVPYVADVGIINDTIAAIGDLSEAKADRDIDVNGLAVSPGFINMLSWADQTLLKDGRSMSDIKQGVTLEVMGEGWSPGPLRRTNKRPVDSLYTTLDGYFRYAMKKGVSCNIASFVGATTIRIYVLEHANRAPTHSELEQMKRLVREAMEQGAMGLSSALIYAPANYASTAELIELAKVASQHDGIYITHMRSEGDQIYSALNETFTISREANLPAEIYHLKINVQRNWQKIDTVLAMIDSARGAGLHITANMYPYIASGTGLSARLPTWVQEGGAKQMRKRLADPEVRKRVLRDMREGIPSKNSDPENVILMHFRLDSLNRLYRGKKLSDVAARHGKDADETAIDLVVKDKSRIEAIFYLQSEENVRTILKQPYVSFGSDGGSYNIDVDTANLPDHPRAFGTFARVLGKYVRQERIIPLQEAIRKLTAMPAENLSIKKRGQLKTGYFADIAVFDPNIVIDRATFQQPNVYAEGMIHVFVNGVQVLQSGRHTGARPGRVIRGPGYKSARF